MMSITRTFALTLLFVIVANAIAASPATLDAPPVATMSDAECEVWAREISFAKALADHDPVTFATHLHEAETGDGARSCRIQVRAANRLSAWLTTG